MRAIKLANKKLSTLSNQPLIAVIGNNQTYRSRLMNDILSNESFYSKKYGRIIYIGERKYRSSEIILDELNWKEKCQYQQFMDFIDDAKTDGIVNLLFVINTKDFSRYQDIVQKLIGIRFTYLPGLISVMVVLNTPRAMKKPLLTRFNNIFYLDTQEIHDLVTLMKVKNHVQEKRKKDVYVIGNEKIQVYKQIKD